MYRILMCLCSFWCLSAEASSSSRSDSIDIRKTTIHFRINDWVNKQVVAHCLLDVQSKVSSLHELVFDLEGLQVDSVRINGSIVPFVQHPGSVQIPLNPVMQVNDTAEVVVYYQGIPVSDAVWGGFYFLGQYAFQMGVGFQAQPHSFGRTWHPCFDNFVERSPYEFFITTEDTLLAMCNGILIDSIYDPILQTKTWHWKLDQDIPAYLAAVAISKYVILQKSLNGMGGVTPAWIACERADTNKVHGSFAHLQQSFTMLEQHFGEHSWPRVGYTLVPFNGGAMEHATNIHIGRAYINGNLDYETLIAHELSHHWWGDLVTCSTAGDMWLNEGFASYAELLHTESVYGKEAYRKAVADNHYLVVSSAHIDDEGYKAVAPMDSLFTYGTTVYKKGADILHTLRAYMGDSLFFNSLEMFLHQHKFSAISSVQLRDALINSSGLPLNHFFDDWVWKSGFPELSIDSVRYQYNGSHWQVRVSIRQRRHKSPDYYHGVPVELAFYDSLMQPQYYRLTMNERCAEFQVNLTFQPRMVVLDPNQWIADAVTDEQRMVHNVGIQTLNQGKLRLHVKGLQNIGDSTLFRAEHHWVAPDRFRQPALFPGFVLADTRYWHIDGVNLQNLQGNLQFTYDAGSPNHYLDSSWVKNAEDSIRMFYRKDAGEEWQFANDSLRIGAPFDRYGNIYVREIKAGDYAFGIKRSTYTDTVQSDMPPGPCAMVTRLEPTSADNMDWQLYPNPARDKLICRFTKHPAGQAKISIYDVSGRCLHTHQIQWHGNETMMNLPAMKPGLYVVRLQIADAGIDSAKQLMILPD